MLRPLVLCWLLHSACGFVTPPTSSTKLAPLRSGGPPVVERPSPDILLSARDDQTQQLGFAAICGGTWSAPLSGVAGLDAAESVPADGWFGAWRDHVAAAARRHLRGGGRGAFHVADAIAIVPPKGTWGGLWQVPAPGAEELNLSYAEYHCYWTGVAEFLGGVVLRAPAWAPPAPGAASCVRASFAAAVTVPASVSGSRRRPCQRGLGAITRCVGGMAIARSTPPGRLGAHGWVPTPPVPTRTDISGAAPRVRVLLAFILMRTAFRTVQSWPHGPPPQRSAAPRAVHGPRRRTHSTRRRGARPRP